QPGTCRPEGRRLEFLHLGLTAKCQLTTALARLRERGDRVAVGEGIADPARKKQPLTSGFAVPSPLRGGPLSTCGPSEDKRTNSRCRPEGRRYIVFSAAS